MADETSRDDYVPPNLNHEEAVAWQQMSADAKRRFQDCDFRIRPFVQGQRVWQDLLTDSERSALGGNLEQVWRERGTLGMWMRAKGYTNRLAALVELTTAISKPGWLMQQANLAGGEGSRPTERPVWNPQTGVLSMGGEPIRPKLRVMREPSHLQRILNAFQEAGWPDAVNNPLEDPRESIQLHQAVHQLNQGLGKIHFSVSQGAAVVCWSRVDD